MISKWLQAWNTQHVFCGFYQELKYFIQASCHVKNTTNVQAKTAAKKCVAQLLCQSCGCLFHDSYRILWRMEFKTTKSGVCIFLQVATFLFDAGKFAVSGMNGNIRDISFVWAGYEDKTNYLRVDILKIWLELESLIVGMNYFKFDLLSCLCYPCGKCGIINLTWAIGKQPVSNAI